MNMHTLPIPADTMYEKEVRLSIFLTPVDSSNLKAVGHHPHLGLVVEFKTGAIYFYPAVGRELYEMLMAAESKGSFFNANVKANAYDFGKLP